MYGRDTRETLAAQLGLRKLWIMVGVFFCIDSIDFIYNLIQYLINKDENLDSRTDARTNIYSPMEPNLADQQSFDLLLYYFMSFLKKMLWQYPFIYILWPPDLALRKKRSKRSEQQRDGRASTYLMSSVFQSSNYESSAKYSAMSPNALTSGGASSKQGSSQFKNVLTTQSLKGILFQGGAGKLQKMGKQPPQVRK